VNRALLATALLLLATGVAEADILHLVGGGRIRTDSWRIDGNTILYESPAGMIGIPYAEVERIEATEPGPTPAPPEPLADAQEETPAPQGVGAVFEEGKQALEGRDFEAAAQRFLDAIRLEPRFAAARVGYAVAVFAMDRDGLALSVIQEGLALDHQNPELHEVMGDLRNREERVEDALRSWRQAYRIAPVERLEEKIRKAERELKAGRDYAFSTAPHFNVRYGDTMDPNLAAEIVDYLEERYWILADVLMHAPEQPITVLLYPEQQFRDVTQAPEQVAGLYDGKIRVPLGGITRIDPRSGRLLTHELTHAVVRSKTRGNCPRWLHEGLAQRFEGRKVSRADQVSILQMLEGIDPSRWEGKGFSYPAALSLVSYLESLRDIDGLVMVLERLGRGERIEAALRSVYGLDHGELCRRWSEALERENRR
jgi:tetratricopeptide (TPR) repeat protein